MVCTWSGSGPMASRPSPVVPDGMNQPGQRVNVDVIEPAGREAHHVLLLAPAGMAARSTGKPRTRFLSSPLPVMGRSGIVDGAVASLSNYAMRNNPAQERVPGGAAPLKSQYWLRYCPRDLRSVCPVWSVRSRSRRSGWSRGMCGALRARVGDPAGCPGGHARRGRARSGLPG
jgi:hypothetical protein